MDTAGVQRRTIAVLMSTQVIGGVGMALGVSVGALLIARLASGPALSGLAQSSTVIGAALLAIPVTQLMNRAGRRPGLLLAYGCGVVGALLVILAAITGWVWLVFIGMFAFGGGTTAGLQARYVATDLATPERRAWYLSVVVWAVTIGSVAGPNLAAPADEFLRRQWSWLPEFAGPFVVSGAVFFLAAVVIGLLLRPDPLLVSRRLADGEVKTHQATRGSLRAAFHLVMSLPAARLGIAAMAIGHAVMVGIMSMTPVHIGESLGGSHGDLLRVVGLVLSVHIAGMYAFSPLVGWVADRWGRIPTILTGFGILLTASAVAATAGHGTFQLSMGLGLLGLGWSCTMIAGSTLLTESVSIERRPSAQGLADLTMGLAGATAGACAGVIVAFIGYSALAVVSVVLILPVIGLALRTRTSVTIGA